MSAWRTGAMRLEKAELAARVRQAVAARIAMSSSGELMWAMRSSGTYKHHFTPIKHNFTPI